MYFSYHFNLTKTNTRNKTRMLGLGKGELTKTRIQVEARGNWTFPPSTPSQSPNLPITWTWIITKDPPRISLPQLPSQATGTQHNSLAADSLLPSIFGCTTHPVPPASIWWMMTPQAWHTCQPKGRNHRTVIGPLSKSQKYHLIRSDSISLDSQTLQ